MNNRLPRNVHRLDGWPNVDLNMARSSPFPAITPAQNAVYNSWGPGKYAPDSTSRQNTRVFALRLLTRQCQEREFTRKTHLVLERILAIVQCRSCTSRCAFGNRYPAVHPIWCEKRPALRLQHRFQRPPRQPAPSTPRVARGRAVFAQSCIRCTGNSNTDNNAGVLPAPSET